MNKAERTAARRAALIPNGVPRYLRCYDLPEYGDRYTVIYTKKTIAKDAPGVFLFVGMSASPFHPQGIGMHGEIKREHIGKHLGKRIPFSALPDDCQTLVLNDYSDIWGIL